MPIDIGIKLDPKGVQTGTTTVKRSLADVDKAATNTQKTYVNAAGRMVDANGRYVKSSTTAAQSSKSLNLGIANLAKTMLAFASAAELANQALKSIQTQRAFEASIADLAAITGAAGNDLKFFSDEAKRLGSTTIFTASQVATAFKLIASAKPDLLDNADALAQVTEQTLLLATASGTELTDAAKTLGGALNQFGQDADEATRFVNVLAAGAKLGSSEINETSEALKNAGVSANTAGISFEETNAAIQVLAATSIKGGEAGTALRNIFLKLETSTNNNLRPSIVGLTTSLKNLDDQNLSSAELVKMFGLENISAAQTILSNREEVERLTGALTGTDTAFEQAAIKANTLDGDIKALQSAFEGLYIAIGENANPAVRDLATFLTEAANNAAFFWASMIEGSSSQLLDQMANVNDEVKKLQARLAKDSFFYTDNDRKQDEYNLQQLQAQLVALRNQYKELQGLSAPLAPPVIAGGGAIPPAGSGGDTGTRSLTETEKAFETNQKSIQRMSQALEVSKLQTQGLELEAKKLQATYALGEHARQFQIDKVHELTEALYAEEQARKAAAKAEREAAEKIQREEQVTQQVDMLAFTVSSPLDQVRSTEEQRLLLLEEFRAIDVANEQEYQDLKNAVIEDSAKQRRAIETQELQTQYAASAAGFEALSDLSAAFVTDQEDSNSTAFALSKAFAAASAGLNLALALSQALADPSALTLPQKIGNYAAVATSGAALISTISSANYATGGFVSGPGNGTSDDIPANLSNGEFVINQKATSANRGLLETINNGGSISASSTMQPNVIVNNYTDSTVTAQADSNGDIQVTVDRRIRELAPSIMGEEVANQYSPYSRARKANYKDVRR